MKNCLLCSQPTTGSIGAAGYVWDSKKERMKLMPAYRPLIERFWEKVTRLSDDKCWTWNGAHHSAGYGVIGIDCYSIDYAHRVSWKLTYGDIPDGLIAWVIIYLTHLRNQRRASL